MSQRKRIYLDHAATSWPKSEAVLAAMDHFHRNEGASAGRGVYAAASRANAFVSECRRRIATWIHASDVNCVSFHSSGTAALNAAIHGLVRPGDHVVTTASEHNSVLRPLTHLQTHHQVDLTIVPCDDEGRVDAARVLDAVQHKTRMVAVTHASNVTGAVQPIARIGEGLEGRGVAFLCDAAQTLGYLPIDVTNMNIDLLAAPGHKGGAGPLGTAILYCGAKWHDEIIPTIQGGTGSRSESLAMPNTMPDKLEPGNLNVPAIVGWSEGIAELNRLGLPAVTQRCREMASMLYNSLAKIPFVRVVGSGGALPLVSLTIDGFSPSELAAVLDAEFSIETRSGYHCAGSIHRYLGTESEGTLRISAGRNTTNEELDALITGVWEIANSVNQ
jgi:cysteine desulfurase family protein